MKIYLDENFKCHTSASENYIVAESSFFDGKCKEFIEGYRFIPEGMEWIRADGAIFLGEMIAPWQSYGQLDDYQRNYEKEQYQNIIDSMGQLVEEVYQSDLSMAGIQ